MLYGQRLVASQSLTVEHVDSENRIERTVMTSMIQRLANLCERRKKIMNRSGVKSRNMQLVPSAGKYATGVKGGKIVLGWGHVTFVFAPDWLEKSLLFIIGQNTTHVTEQLFNLVKRIVTLRARIRGEF